VAPSWSPARRVAFRFAFAYFALYLFPFPLSALPLPGATLEWWVSFEQWLSGWTQVHLFGLAEPMPVVPTGSGDTLGQWATQVNWLLLAALAALVWSLVDHRRREYARLWEWLRVYVRFGLATIMFGYGFAKVIPTQMPAPALERLVEPYGEFSPMGVLWSFMGTSAIYQIFTGVGESLGALLLVFRRTVTLGALLLCAVLANVVLLNYTYDVPVKLYSTNLLIMAVWLAAPDAKRLIDVLVLNRASDAPPLGRLFVSRRLHLASIALRTIFAIFVMWTGVTSGIEYYRQSVGPDAPKSPFYGIWDVEEVRHNATVKPLLVTDSTLVRKAVFGGLNRATFRLMADSVQRYTFATDSARRTITLTARFDPKQVRTLGYARPDSAHLVLTEILNGDSTTIRLRRFDEKRLTLLSRGYNWIQEQPFNR
jgi:hypothetical protein